jgi:dTDP-4-dehydrorhamnose reductase
MKIVLFGGSGQLGYELVKRASDLHFELVAPVTKEVDITSRSDVFGFIARSKPDVIINSAAYTAVDKAESEPERAFKVNHEGVRYLAEAARQYSARMLLLSTDYVFDGKGELPLAEEAPTNPINVYGKSKLAGELEVERILGKQGLVVRTSSLHGQRGTNFVHTMIDLLTSREIVSVVNDQFMCPTWAGWLAEVTLDLIRVDCHGIIHAAGQGVTSWFNFASEIRNVIEGSGRFSGQHLAKIEPVSGEKFIRPAKRPAYSALDSSKLSKVLGRPNISWQTGLKFHMSELGYD